MMMMMMMMMILYFKKTHSLYITGQNFTIPEKLTFKLVGEGHNLENEKNEFDSFFLLLP